MFCIKKCQIHHILYLTTIICDMIFTHQKDYGVERHFKQYFSYIVTVSFIGEETGVPRENHKSMTSFIT